jgi:hypothetical protein
VSSDDDDDDDSVAFRSGENLRGLFSLSEMMMMMILKLVKKKNQQMKCFLSLIRI